MPRRPELSDLALVILANAAKRDDGQLLPLASSIADNERTTAEFKSLLKRKLIAETPAKDARAQWRANEGSRIGLVLTDAGRAAIGVEVETDNQPAYVSAPANDAPPSTDISPPAATRRASKRDAVVALLRQEGGANLTQLGDTTGWQAHSLRAFLTGLRKQGLAVTRGKREGETCYSLTEAGNGQG